MDENIRVVRCPSCGRALSHHLGGTTSVYRSVCQRCKSKVLIYSAGKTAIFKETMIKIEANIKIIDNTSKS